MHQFKKHFYLHANVDALVNAVNTVGVMGKGIALQFKQIFPKNFAVYEEAAKRGKIVPGKMFVFETGQFTLPRYIINFPTKRHWRDKALLQDIEFGMDDLINVIFQNNIRSIAIPQLGCGLGGLDWEKVRPVILSALEKVPDLNALIYLPEGTPVPEQSGRF